ncbi:uncharacterized protein LACBIDRAFT_333424 [Laccaria bicolor S238N-H82]|uniref:Predicted protein n=1 Tax=Laccaria bicolor (strain S238N-H82 / ATCC MYA-4686) TaxID=486041 RepID=B0DVV8_LACBS|nr:uncharacterized protein LACBIDRAFT_333424 [Laccaria bicolor S238N-H82]EDR01369.1 predicted protein [Laccaria bicolor S238N-H82]|eukprot:XP_001888076.1 predicted protein [Laccaria bicolor S238N-H82]
MDSPPAPATPPASPGKACTPPLTAYFGFFNTPVTWREHMRLILLNLALLNQGTRLLSSSRLIRILLVLVDPDKRTRAYNHSYHPRRAFEQKPVVLLGAGIHGASAYMSVRWKCGRRQTRSIQRWVRVTSLLIFYLMNANLTDLSPEHQPSTDCPGTNVVFRKRKRTDSGDTPGHPQTAHYNPRKTMITLCTPGSNNIHDSTSVLPYALASIDAPSSPHFATFGTRITNRQDINDLSRCYGGTLGGTAPSALRATGKNVPRVWFALGRTSSLGRIETVHAIYQRHYFPDLQHVHSIEDSLSVVPTYTPTTASGSHPPEGSATLRRLQLMKLRNSKACTATLRCVKPRKRRDHYPVFVLVALYQQLDPAQLQLSRQSLHRVFRWSMTLWRGRQLQSAQTARMDITKLVMSASRQSRTCPPFRHKRMQLQSAFDRVIGKFWSSAPDLPTPSTQRGPTPASPERAPSPIQILRVNGKFWTGGACGMSHLFVYGLIRSVEFRKYEVDIRTLN